MNKNFKFLSVILSLMLCFAATAFGQETTGGIEGTIKDPNGAVVPGASVTIESAGSTAGYKKTVTTDENGYFIVRSLPVGNYKVTVGEAKGFKGTTSDVTVVLGKDAQANIALEVGTGTQIVDINSNETAVLDPTDSKLTTNITSQIIDSLPKGTTFTSLLKTAPNVRSEALSGGFQIDGASGSENVFVIDGQEVTNFRTGTLNSNNNLPFELVQEVQIKSTGFEAEYGGATGGVINVVTAGGNNQFRGNFGISFEPQKLQGSARPFLNQYGLNPGETEYFQRNRLGGTNFYPVARLSGPVVKDKLWFSAVYAPQIFDNTQDVRFFTTSALDALGRRIPSSNPNIRQLTETQRFNLKRTIEEAFIRLDAQPTSKLRMFGTFLWNPIVDKGALPTNQYGLSNFSTVNPFGPVFNTNELLNNQGGRQNSNNINGQATYTPTNSIVLNFRAGRSFLNEKLGSYGIPRAVQFVCQTASAFPQNIPASGCSPGFANFPSNFQIDYDVSTRTTIDADASFVGINLGGRHNFKFGYQYNRLSNTTSQGYADTGIVNLYYGRSIASLLGTPTTTVPDCDPVRTGTQSCGSGFLQRFGTIGQASSSNVGLFAQDSWQIGSRLTLNLGLRIEREDVPSFNADNPGITFGWGDKPAPRLGFAFDVFGNGKSKIFGSYGWFYDRFKYELPRGSFGGDFFRRDYFEILATRGLNYASYTRQLILGTVPDLPGGNCPDPPNPNLPYPPLGNGYSICQADFRIPSNSITGDIFTSGAVDPDLKAARQSEYTIGYEQLMFKNMLFSARYTHKQVDRAIEDIGFPTAQGSEAYIIGNPGLGLAAQIATDNDYVALKAKRTYDALEFRLDKRFSNNYFFNVSYTYSRLFGNYSGLASSDEAGRTSPNVSRSFDLPFLGFTADGAPDDGRLATDRPHVFKAYAGYSFDWWGSKTNKTDISFFTSIQSGTPITTFYQLYSVATAILNERGDLGRTEKFTETDFQINHRYKFGRDDRFTFEPFLNIRNLFDEDNELTRQNLISTINFSAGTLGYTDEVATIQAIFNGGIRNRVNACLNRAATSPAACQALSVSQTFSNTFNLTNSFQTPREVRFGARFYF